MISKKTKIVCTIGPATEDENKLEALLKAGMNVMRLNFSHGDFAEHQKRVDSVRKVSVRTGIPVAIMQDLAGPKIRIGTFSTDSTVLKEGKLFTLTTDEIVGDETRAHVNYDQFAKEVKKGHIVFLHDGRRKLEVVEVKGNDVVCKIIVGGEIKGKRGVNLPDSELSLSSISKKDRSDLEFGIQNNVDFIALSFIRRSEDITELRAILKKAKLNAGIVAKIETPQAVAHIDAIIELADAIMVARGDLAIEIAAEDVPVTQKMIIKKCNIAGKPVITATQMLESMIKNPVPTRAEVSDIANAILDGTDAIMLSEETTLGDFPVEAVKMMSRIAKKVEGGDLHQGLLNGHSFDKKIGSIGESLTTSAVRTADRVGAKFIVSLTESGYSARMIARYKPRQTILVFTPNQKTYYKSILSFGTYPVLIKRFKNFNEVLTLIREYCFKNKIAKKDERVVVASGMPFGKVIETNMLLVETL